MTIPGPRRGAVGLEVPCKVHVDGRTVLDDAVNCSLMSFEN
jgi:hypothetical protein